MIKNGIAITIIITIDVLQPYIASGRLNGSSTSKYNEVTSNIKYASYFPTPWFELKWQ